MSPAECEVVADAGLKLRLLSDGMFAAAGILGSETLMAEALTVYAGELDAVRGLLSALPLEAEGE